MENDSNFIDKDNAFEIFKEYTPSFEELPNPFSSSNIEKNDRKEYKIILQNPEILLEKIQNFSNAETNDTNKYIKKKEK